MSRLPPTVKGKRVLIPKEKRASYSDYQRLLELAARHYAKLHDVDPDSFVIKYWPSVKFEWKIKSGYLNRVYFTHTVKAPDLAKLMGEVMSNLKRLQEQRPGKSIELYGGLKDRAEQVQAQFDSILGIVNGMLKNEEVEENVTITVSVKHRATGMIVSKDTKFGDISRNLVSSRIELTELVKLVAMKQRDDANKAQTENQLAATDLTPR